MSLREINAMRKKHVADPDENTMDRARSEASSKASEIADEVDALFGKGTVIRVNDGNYADLTGGGYSTGLQEIDDVLSGTTDKMGATVAGSGIGFPKGRMIEIFGPESSSKTSLGLLAVAECQRQGGVAAFVDVEHALDLSYARYLGVDTNALLIFQPDTAEETVAITKALVKRGVHLTVVDSVAAMTPKSEFEAEGHKGKGGMGESARIMSGACRQINSLLKPGGPTVIWLNQIRYKIGVMFGNPEMTSGGNALKFYASVRLDLRRIKTLFVTRKGKKVVTGVRIRAKTVKNKVVPPFREVIFDIIFNKGIVIPTEDDLKKKGEDEE